MDRGGAWDEVVALAERHSARVYGAPMSGRCGFPEDHRLFGGFLPAMRERIVELLDGHDVVFAVGAPTFTYHVEGEGPHVPKGTQLFQLIEDPAIASWSPLGTAVVGSVRLGLLDLLERPAPRARPLPPARRRSPPARAPRAGERMSVAYLMQTLAELRDPQDIIAEEAPSSRPVVQEYLPVLRPESYYTMCSGGLGHSLPAGVGVALARRDRRVIAVIGDGSSMYAIQALWSAAQLRLPMTIVIVNNGRYAALQGFAKVFGYAPDAPVQGTALPEIDFVSLAKGHGCTGVRVEKGGDLHAALKKALKSKVPCVVDVLVD